MKRSLWKPKRCFAVCITGCCITYLLLFLTIPDFLFCFRFCCFLLFACKNKQASLVSKAFHQLSHQHPAFFVFFAFCSLFAAFPFSGGTLGWASGRVLWWWSPPASPDGVIPEHPSGGGELWAVCFAEVEAIKLEYFNQITSWTAFEIISRQASVAA